MALPTSQHNVTVRKLSSTLNSYNTKVNTKLGGKADKVTSATNGDFAGLDANGNLTDSGKKASDFATSAQGTKADSAIQSVKVEGTALTPDTNKAVNVTKTSLGLNNVTNDAQVKRSEMGVANGVATLGSDGKVPSAQLPSFVDDVIEGYYYHSKFYRDKEYSKEITPAAGIIYVDLPTNKTYRWGGSDYVVISETLALGETSSTAYRGDRGKTAYDHSQLTSGNPHNVTKSDVGLGSVVNTGDSATPVSGGTTKFTTGGAYTELAKKADKSTAVTNVAYDSTNKKLTKTINGTTSDIVTVDTLKTALNLSKSDVGLGNVDNKSEATIKSDFTGSVARGNTGFPTGGDVFTAIAANKGIVIVDTTTGYDSVKDVIDDGRIPVYHEAWNSIDFYLYLTCYDPDHYRIKFGAVYEGTLYEKQCIKNPNLPTWGELVSTPLEETSNKVTSWSSTTTDTNYPSEKLVKNSLDNKVDKETGKGLSTNDYTTAEQTKLAGIATGATKVEASSTNGKIKINGTDTTVYTHPTTSGNKHIPAGGSSGQILSYSAAGTAQWETLLNVKQGFGGASATRTGTSSAFTVNLSGYTLSGGQGGIIAVLFSVDVPASATLNVNSTGAKSIKYKSAAITAGVIQSGDMAFFMYGGEAYNLLGTDRSIEEMTDTEVTDLVNALE